MVNGGNFFNQKNKINCEIVGKVTGTFLQTIQQDTDCVRLIPMVTYKWEPSPTTFQIAVNKISAFYRLEFGALEPGGRGLATFGGDTPGFLPPEVSENRFVAVKNGKSGEIDNIHDLRFEQGLFVPGCRPSVFDCFHMHWRWNPPAVTCTS